MLQINLITGKAGSGKSAVAKELRERGYPVLEVDEIFTDMLRLDPVFRALMLAKFGTGVMDAENKLSAEFSEKYLNDDMTYDWVWSKASPAICSVLGNALTALWGQMCFIEVSVISGWLASWLGVKARSSKSTCSRIGIQVIRMPVREFRIEVSDDSVRVERRVAEFVQQEGLYLGEGGSAFDVIFHSPVEAERNRKLCDAYRATIRRLDDIRAARAGSLEGDQFIDFVTRAYTNDAEDDPGKIAARIAGDVFE